MNDEQEALAANIDALTPMGVRYVSQIVDSLASPPTVETRSSWLTSDSRWVEYFGLTISGHHGATTEPLGLISFEIAFQSACEAVDWKMDPAGSATQRFLDTTLRTPDGQERKISLKSTAAQKLSKSTIHISKLTEAAWIQDMRSKRQRRDRTVELFREYRAAVDSIIMFRAFRENAQSIPYRYQLVEIPSAIFESIENAPLDAFASDGPTIDCGYRGHSRAARVSLDRSDSKITVKQIQLSVCTVHAEWHLSMEG